jgi:hypothetical protein
MRVGITRGLGARAYFEARGGQQLSYVPGYWLIWVANEMFGQSLRVSKANLGCEVRKLERGWNNPTGLGAFDCKTESF